MAIDSGVGQSGGTPERVESSSVAPSGTVSRQALVQLLAGLLCMAMVANLQYGWTIFVNPIHIKYGWSAAAIQLAFTLFIQFETWLVPFEAYLADRFGPRPIVMIGAVLIGASWIIYSKAATLAALYAGGIVGGIGTGFVYGTCIGNAVKWFEKRRGLAAGFTAAGFGAGAAVTVLPLTHSLAQHGYQATFFKFALIQGGVVLLAALLLRKPPGRGAARAVNARLLHTNVDATPMQTLRSPVFYVMYLAFVCVAAGGLVATAQLALIANGFGIANTSVRVLGVVGPALTFALSLNNLMNGLSRPLFGWISDWLGRELTMCLTFLLEGIGILCLAHFGRNPVDFVILAGLVFFAWGNIFSIFPALTSDHFGRRYASTNYAILYTAKGVGSWAVPLASFFVVRGVSWASILVAAAIGNFIASAIMMVLPGLRARELRRQEQGLSGPAALAPAMRSETSSA